MRISKAVIFYGDIMKKMKKAYYFSCILVVMLGLANANIVLGSASMPIAPIENYQSALQPDLRFLTKIEAPVPADWSSRAVGAVMESESIIYVDTGVGSAVEKGIIIRTYQIRGGPKDIIPDMDFRNKAILAKGTSRIASKDFSYAILIDQGLIDQNEIKSIKDGGLLVPDCKIVKVYRGKLLGYFQKSKSQIIYFERIKNTETPSACNNMTPSETDMKSFSDRADVYFRQLLSVKDNEITTANETTAKKPKSEVSIGKDNDLEKKLSTLKNLLDKRLITQEDYEKKKAKLLEEF